MICHYGKRNNSNQPSERVVHGHAQGVKQQDYPDDQDNPAPHRLLVRAEHRDADNAEQKKDQPTVRQGLSPPRRTIA